MENDTTENKEQSNILLYSLAGLLVVITGFVVYIYIGFDMVKKGDLEEKYIKTDAKIFEVIGMVDIKEFKILNKLRQNNDTPEVDRISNFAQLGLSRQRVIEATWGIKGYLGTQTNIKVVNYTIVSKKKYKGFIVRAYKYK